MDEFQQHYVPPFSIRFFEGSKPTVGVAFWPRCQPRRWRITATGPLLPKTETSLVKGTTEAELLTSARNGRQIHFQTNTRHPLFPELQSMVRKTLGMDRIIDSIIQHLGNLQEAFLTDDYAAGKDAGNIDLVLVGNIDWRNLEDLTAKTERHMERKIRILVLTPEECDRLSSMFADEVRLVLWQRPKDAIGTTGSEAPDLRHG